MNLQAVNILRVVVTALWLAVSVSSLAVERTGFAKPDLTLRSAPRAYFKWFEYSSHDTGAANLTWRDDFDSTTFKSQWQTPQQPWADVASTPGWLTLYALRTPLQNPQSASFLAQRQQHRSFEISTEVETPPIPHLSVGLVVFQNGNDWYFFGVHRRLAGGLEPRQMPLEVFVETRKADQTEIIARRDIDHTDRLKLKIDASSSTASFYFDDDESGWKPLKNSDDGSVIRRNAVGDSVGALTGPYARAD